MVDHIHPAASRGVAARPAPGAPPLFRNTYGT